MKKEGKGKEWRKKRNRVVIRIKLIYVLSPFHMLFLNILYPNSCKTNNLSSKLGFVGFLMESK